MVAIARMLVAPLAGYATIVIGALLFQDLLFGGVTDKSPLFALIVGGGLATLAAVGGGYLLAMISPRSPLWNAMPLVVWLVIESTLLHFQLGFPIWFSVLAGVTAILGILAGVLLWLRRNSPAQSNATQPNAMA